MPKLFSVGQTSSDKDGVNKYTGFKAPPMKFKTLQPSYHESQNYSEPSSVGSTARSTTESNMIVSSKVANIQLYSPIDNDDTISSGRKIIPKKVPIKKSMIYIAERENEQYKVLDDFSSYRSAPLDEDQLKWLEETTHKRQNHSSTVASLNNTTTKNTSTKTLDKNKKSTTMTTTATSKSTTSNKDTSKAASSSSSSSSSRSTSKTNTTTTTTSKTKSSSSSSSSTPSKSNQPNTTHMNLLSSINNNNNNNSLEMSAQEKAIEYMKTQFPSPNTSFRLNTPLYTSRPSSSSMSQSRPSNSAQTQTQTQTQEQKSTQISRIHPNMNNNIYSNMNNNFNNYNNIMNFNNNGNNDMISDGNIYDHFPSNTGINTTNQDNYNQRNTSISSTPSNRNNSMSNHIVRFPIHPMNPTTTFNTGTTMTELDFYMDSKDTIGVTVKECDEILYQSKQKQINISQDTLYRALMIPNTVPDTISLELIHMNKYGNKLMNNPLPEKFWRSNKKIGGSSSSGKTKKSKKK